MSFGNWILTGADGMVSARVRMVWKPAEDRLMFRLRISQIIRKKPFRALLSAGLGAAGFCTVFALCSELAVEACGNRVYRSVESAPPRRTGLLLGTARTVADGRGNLYFRYRIEAAAALYRAGKIEMILVSGDNSRKEYNEPLDMKLALIEAGVPEEAIAADYAGFRTLDSVVRAQRIFGQTQFTVISQAFHCKRAIYIARQHGIDAIGFAARDVKTTGAWLKNRLREVAARVAAVIDTRLLGRKPKFGGEPIELRFPEKRPENNR